MTGLVLSLPAEPRFVGLARHLAGQLALRAGVPEVRVDDVKVAVTELVTSAVHSQVRVGADGPVELGIRLHAMFQVTVSDRGDGLARTSAELSGLAETDLGLLITRELVGNLEVEPRVGGGSTVSFTLRSDAGG